MPRSAESSISQEETQQSLKRKIGHKTDANNNEDSDSSIVVKKLNHNNHIARNPLDHSASKNGGFWGQPRAKTVAEVKVNSMQNVKAQLTLSLIEYQQKSDLLNNHVTVLNTACNMAKVTWRVEFNDAKICTENSVRESWLTVDDVVVLKMCYLIDEETSKMLMCEKAIDLFRRCSDLDVKRGENGSFELYVNINGSTDSIGPESYITEALLKALLQFRDFWIQNKQSFKP
uniref:Uncharacterized protein n=1 Tax=Romanomermis culicivorax TaxID=13658 RepID=A0A915I183_ROMCU